MQITESFAVMYCVVRCRCLRFLPPCRSNRYTGVMNLRSRVSVLILLEQIEMLGVIKPVP